jgi:hypothetical protein
VSGSSTTSPPAQDDTLDAALRSVPGQRSGISIGYFFILAGDHNMVDRTA